MDIHYNAFISYRHHPDDIKVAEQIHKGLERYRVPKALKKKKDTKMRLFRDKEELPITSNLTDDISRALRNSEFLIVICSPHTQESVWVQREIETFLQSHDRSRILTVIAAGEPYDVIPQILCQEERIDPATGQTQILPIEPLSCDWRIGKRKAHREELPRLAAALLGCGYDELRQRERQYRTRRLVTLFSLALAAVIGFTSYVIYNSIQIQKANDRLTDANIAIQKNLEESQINQSQFLASASTQQFDAGDRMLALALAMEALPKEENPRPYVARAEKALADAVGAYLAQEQTVAIGAISCDALINYFAATDERDKMFVTDQRGLLSVWELENFQQTAVIDPGLSISKLMVTPEDTVLVFSLPYLACYDAELNLLWKADSISEFCLSAQRDVVIAESNDNTLVFLDAATGQPVRDSIAIPNKLEGSDQTWSINFKQETYDLQQPIPLVMSGYEEPDHIVTLDLQTGTVTQLGSVNPEFLVRGTAYTEDGNLLVLAAGENGTWNSLFNTMMTHSLVKIQIFCFSPEGKTLWCSDLTSYTYSREWTLYNIPGTEKIFCQVDNILSVLDRSTGQILSCCETGATPVWASAFDTYALALLEDGSMGSYTYDRNEFNSTRYFKEDISDGFAGKGVFIKQNYSNEILVYSTVMDDNWQTLDDNYSAVIVHRATCGDLVAFYNYDSICVFDIRQQKLLWNIAEIDGSRYQLLEFSDEGKYLWFCDQGNTLICMDMRTGQQETYPLFPKYGQSNESLFYSYNNRICLDKDRIYVLASGLTSNELYVVTLNMQTRQMDITPAPQILWESFQTDSELMVAHEGSVYLWDSTEGTVHTVNTLTKEVSLFAQDLNSRPVIQYLADGETYMVATEAEVSFYRLDGSLLFTHALENRRGVSAYRTTGNELILLTDTGAFLRYSVDGQFLGEFEAHIYSSFSNTISTNFEPEEIVWTETGDGSLFVDICESGNLLDMQSWDHRAWVPNCVAYLPALDQFVTQGQDEELDVDRIGVFPRYSLEDIQQMAREALKGYTLTQDMKEYYGIS